MNNKLDDKKLEKLANDIVDAINAVDSDRHLELITEMHRILKVRDLSDFMSRVNHLTDSRRKESNNET